MCNALCYIKQNLGTQQKDVQLSIIEICIYTPSII